MIFRGSIFSAALTILLPGKPEEPDLEELLNWQACANFRVGPVECFLELFGKAKKDSYQCLVVTFSCCLERFIVFGLILDLLKSNLLA